MTQQASDGLRMLRNLQIGAPELSWVQSGRAARLQTLTLGMGVEPGWVGTSLGNGASALGWELYDNAGSVAVRLQTSPAAPNRLRKTTVPFLGVEPFGAVLEVTPGTILDSSGDPITVPSDDTWYTLVAKYTLNVREPGTITLTAGSTTITGVGTNFTRYAAGPPDDPRAMKLRVDTTDTVAGNAGIYVLATVVDDTNATLVAAPPNTETGVRFRIHGDFLGTVPADPDCHWNGSVTWEMRARTVTRPTDGLIAYDLKRASVGNTLALIDRRHAQVYREADGLNRGYMPTFLSRFDDTLVGAGAAALLGGGTIYTCAANEIVSHLSLTGCTDGAFSIVGDGVDYPTCILAGLLVENTSTGNDRFVVKTGLPWIGIGGTRWVNPDNGGAVNVTSETGLLGIALTALPLGTGFTHLAFYIDSTGNLKTKTSVDNGANWVGPTTIWTPPSTDVLGAGGVAVLLTRLGRLIAVGSYKPAGGAAELRYIYSDDYGTTWTTNSNNGLDILENAAECPTLVEDDDGNIWLAYRSGGDTGSAEAFIIRGAGVNDPTKDASVPGDGWTFGDPPAGAAAGRKLVALAAAPGGGNVAAYYTSQADVGAYTSWLGVASLSEGLVLHDDGKRIVLYNDPGMGTAYANPEPIATYVGHNGLVWVAVLAGYEVGGSAKVRSYCSVLQPMHRAHAPLPGY